MKRGFLALVLFISIVFLAAEPVDLNTAETAAMNWMNYQYGMRNIEWEISVEDTYVHTLDNQIIFYLFDFAPQGFVMVAGDNASVPILGYSVNGASNAPDFPPNSAPFIEMYEQGMEEIHGRRLSNEATIEDWNAILNNEIPENRDFLLAEPLLSTKWNQDYPWNQSCPTNSNGPGGHVYAGCVAVAMAQAMRYWSYPEQGTGSHSYYHYVYGLLSANFGATTYDWDDMPYYTATLSTSELLFHLGVSVDMWYSPNGSGASSWNARNSLIQYFGYHSSAQLVEKLYYSNTQWINILKNEIDNLRPMYYHGYGSGGHAFNCDGYDADNRFHFNWGWGGSLDGYFHITQLNPGGSNFSEDQGAIINLFPAAPYPYPPTHLAAEPGNQFVNLSWSAPDYARYTTSSENGDTGSSRTNRSLTGYNIYRNGEQINTETVVSTYYTDTEVVNNETYTYYVTAVYLPGESISSNRVSTTPSIALPPTAGQGTISSPYVIESIENLFWAAMNPARWGYHYIQSADIDLSDTVNWFDGQGWRPIGNNMMGFTGSYDGQGYSVSNMHIARGNTSDLGFFGSLIGATIRNVHVVDADVSGYNNSGALAGTSYNSLIENCFSTGSVTGEGNFIGGLVGNNRESTINNSFSICQVTGSGNFTGNLVGFNRDSVIMNSYSFGSVSGEISVGGLVGLNYQSSIENSYSRSTVEGQASVGGLVGTNNYSSVENSYSTGSVTGNSSAGGLVGVNTNSDVVNSYWDTETSGRTVSDGGEGRTTAEMTYPYAVNTYIDWDFEYIWSADHDASVNNGYPFLELTLSVEESDLIVPENIIVKNYPNPFNPETNISFSVRTAGKVELKVYNIRGQLINTLLNENKLPGEYSVLWNGKDDQGRTQASGVYLYRIDSADYSVIRRMILLK